MREQVVSEHVRSLPFISMGQRIVATEEEARQLNGLLHVGILAEALEATEMLPIDEAAPARSYSHELAANMIRRLNQVIELARKKS